MGLGITTVVTIVRESTLMGALTGSTSSVDSATKCTTGGTSRTIMIGIEVGIVNVNVGPITTATVVVGSIEGATKTGTHHFLDSTKVTLPLPLLALVAEG